MVPQAPDDDGDPGLWLLAAIATVARASPSPDRDGDGLPDWCDVCPDEPEDQDGFADSDGCAPHQASP